MKKKGKKKRKLNKKRFFIFLLILFLFIFVIYKACNTKIKNIYISGNDYLTDQEIIDLAGLKNYPNSINNSSFSIKKKLKKNDYIIDATVKKKKLLSEVYIEIEENYPLFYYQITDKYIMYDEKELKEGYDCPTVINQIPSTIYDKFIEKIKLVDKDILYRISEIEYKPNDVDDERFLFLMNDDNYVYITLSKLKTINKYLDILNSFGNKKGILYLDSGEYFDVFEE